MKSGIYSFILFLLLILSACNYGIETNQNVMEDGEINVAAEEGPEEVPGSIGMGVETFRKQFNEALLVEGSLPELEVSNGAVQNTFSHELHPGFMIGGIENKLDKSVRSVDVMMYPNDTELEFVDRIRMQYYLSESLICAVSPSYSEEEVANILSEIKIRENVDEEFGEGDIYYGGFHYINMNPGLIIESEEE